ncbi:MAG: choice-of-anchor D domain-containing protein, partial [Verrucomicrobiae bacterium]|nr:choice-of-anchor D domain-containing protein [Verrucomicrobiae bacterium]
MSSPSHSRLLRLGTLTLLVLVATAKLSAQDPLVKLEAFIKASNTGSSDSFGAAIALSGNTAVVGAELEDGDAAGVNGDDNNNLSASGAAYVYVRNGATWAFQAYLKAASPIAGAHFGHSVAISGDTIIVGAHDDGNGSATVFVRQGTTWTLQATLFPSDPTANNLDEFGRSVSIHADTAVVGSPLHNLPSVDAGAAYVFTRDGTVWSEHAKLTASNAGNSDNFGHSVAISGDAIVVGANQEDSNATGINGDGANNASTTSGAAYVFRRTGNQWTEEAYLKASNTGSGDSFGESVAISGNSIVVGADGEDSNARGVNGDQDNAEASSSGAAYVFVYDGGVWSQQAYLKASNTGASDSFGESVGISGDLILVGAQGEDSDATGINGDGENDSRSLSGAAYLFARSGSIWTQIVYLKSDEAASDQFASAVAIDAGGILIGVEDEDSSTSGIDPARNNSGSQSGAVFAYSAHPVDLPEISITGASVSIPDGSTSPSSANGTDFGSSGIVTNVFTITNSGTATLTVAPPIISGTAANDFSVTSPPFQTVAPGASTSFAVKFAPTAVGLRTATLSIGNNDADEDPYEFALQGIGSGAPEIGILGLGLEIADGDITPDTADGTDFGAHDFFVGMTTNSFTVTNSGTATLLLETVSLAGPGVADFRLLKQPSSRLDPGQSSQFSIAFDPSSVLPSRATISLPSSDADEAVYDFAIEGISSPEQEIALFGNGIEIFTGDTTPDAAKGTDFGTLTLGIGSVTNKFTLTNSGTATLTYSSPTITGAAGFSVIAPAALSLAPGEMTSFAITYAPTANGARTATVTLASNDRDEPEFTFAIAAIALPPPTLPEPVFQTYLTNEFRDTSDFFGRAVAVSGNTAVVGSPDESSAATGIDGDRSDNTASDAGAAFVYVRQGDEWVFQAYLKASNTGANDEFGSSVSIDGDTIVVGAPNEDGDANGVNGDGANDNRINSGAAYVFVRNGATWTQQAYLKPGINDRTSINFGTSVSLMGDTLVVGTPGDDTLVSDSGAAYVFVRTDGTWSQQQLLKASNAGGGDEFGGSVSIHLDTIVVGAIQEDSTATGINGDGSNNSDTGAGAAYVFVRSGSVFAEQAYLKASNSRATMSFGCSVSVHGETVVVGARRESGKSTGVDCDDTQIDTSSSGQGYFSGAAYVFQRQGDSWSQQAYLKASNAEARDNFGESVSIFGDYIAVGASEEDSNATGLNGDQENNSKSGSGAAYLFHRSGTNWIQNAYLKPTHTASVSGNGESVALAGSILIIGGPENASSAGGAYTLDFSTPEFTLIGNAADIPGGTNAPSLANQTDFGATSLGTPGVTNTFVITNTGYAVLTFAPPSLSGAAAAEFSVISSAGPTIPPGASASFGIVFTPTAIGTRDAIVSIANNDLDENPFTFLVQGTGVGAGAPEIAVYGNNVSISDGDNAPTSVSTTDFGDVDILFGILTNTFVITNEGNVNLTLSAPTIGGPAAGDYSIVNVPSTSLQPGSGTTLEIAFNPSVLGIRSATVSIGNNDGDEDPFNFAIQGNGVGSAVIKVAGAGLPIANGASTPNAVNGTDFGTLDIAAAPVNRTFTITNSGSLP